MFHNKKTYMGLIKMSFKKEGIICSADAFCISICVVVADTDDTLGDTTYQAGQSTRKTSQQK